MHHKTSKQRTEENLVSWFWAAACTGTAASHKHCSEKYIPQAKLAKAGEKKVILPVPRAQQGSSSCKVLTQLAQLVEANSLQALPCHTTSGDPATVSPAMESAGITVDETEILCWTTLGAPSPKRPDSSGVTEEDKIVTKHQRMKLDEY
ncbi:hypothetical protein BTVI_154792 [Pitangus sulphuratus]|nr:hypothetical protein BTVI_154792 [Pitangus sulphuratus]